jgi:ribosomal protein S6--L-glutamate ligase
MDTYLLKLDGARIEDADNSNFILKNQDDNKGFVVNKNNTVIISRRGVVKNTHTRGIQSLLENHGFFCINSLNSIDICENKFITAEKLIHADLPTPKTALVPNMDNVESALESIGGKFPVILKTLSGSHGIGVSIIDSMPSLVSVLQTLWKLSTTEVLIQEKIESDHDIRIQVLTKRFNYHKADEDNVKIIGYMRRNRVDDKDFRTNHSLGGTVEKIKITKEQEELAIRAAAVMGCHWCGVDIITDDKTGKNYILEVNASPGTKGIKKVIGKSILDDIIKFISDRDNWTAETLEIGFRETIKIEDIGDFVAKFDSGNGAKSSSLHADTIEEKDGHVNWTLNGKKYSSKIIGHSNAEIGVDIIERPIVELDIVFNNRNFSGVHFSLTDRSTKSTSMLINRTTMERMGVSVNPQKTFIVTYFDGYSAKTAKTEKYHSIKFKK